MDQLLKTISDLHLTHIYVHADEDIYRNIVQLKWKYKDLYRNIVPLIGGFHELRVFQRLICKRFSCLSLQQLFLDAKAMPSGVVHKGFSAYHYYFCMDVVKVAFCAILQIRMETLTSSYSKLSPELLHSMRTLKENLSDQNLSAVLKSKHLDNLISLMKNNEGTQGKMMWAFLEDVGALLALISVVRENCYKRHLAAERHMLPLLYMLDHPRVC